MGSQDFDPFANEKANQFGDPNNIAFGPTGRRRRSAAQAPQLNPSDYQHGSYDYTKGDPSTGAAQYGSNGPTWGIQSYYGLPMGSAAGSTGQPAGKGVLSGPTQYNQWYDQFKKDPNAGYFQARTSSNLQQLYNNGDPGYNKYWQQALDKGSQDITDRMAAMGVLGSGATAGALSNLNAKLGAQYGLHMADLAGSADQEESRRINDYWDIAGKQGGLADTADKSLERREHMGLEDKRNAAGDMAGIFSSFSNKSTDEQRDILEQIIQSGIASGATDRAHADQWAEDLFKTYGIVIRAADLRSGRGTTGTSPEIMPPGSAYP